MQTYLQKTISHRINVRTSSNAIAHNKNNKSTTILQRNGITTSLQHNSLCQIIKTPSPARKTRGREAAAPPAATLTTVHTRTPNPAKTAPEKRDREAHSSAGLRTIRQFATAIHDAPARGLRSHTPANIWISGLR